MTEERKYTEQEWHRKSAVDLFNSVWSLLEKEDRTREEDDRMVHAAHASRLHWGEVGTAVNLVRGEWQVSRVYSVLERPQPAMYHAMRCLEICEANDIGDFDLAFAYEALARASAVAGKKDKCQNYVELAKGAGEQIKEKEDRDLFFSDLDMIPEYEKKQ
ncbi:MAG: hypothetical protein ACE5IB_05985 [Candidatus Geothermarchaeales archaeon]